MVAALAILAMMACVLCGGMPSAQAAASGSDALQITSITPSVAGPDEKVVVTGTLTNPTDHYISPKLTVQVSPQLLDTTSKIDQWDEGDLQLASQKVGSQTLALVAPDDSADFSITIPQDALNYTYGLASLPMTLTATGKGMPRQVERTTLQWASGTTDNPIDTTIVVPLTLPADPDLFGPSGPQRVAAWQQAIGPGSRIDKLVRSLGNLPVTWVVDPALVHPPVAADPDVPAPTSPSGSPSGSATPSPSSSSTPGPSDGAPPSESSEGGEPSPGASDDHGIVGGVPLPDPSDDGAPLPTPTPSGEESSGPETIAALSTGLLERLHTLGETGTVWWMPQSDPDLKALSSSPSGRHMLERDLKRGLPAALRDVDDTVVAWPSGSLSAKQVRSVASTWRAGTGQAPLMLLPQRNLTHAATAPDTTRKVRRTGGVLTYDETLSRVLLEAEGDPMRTAQQLMARTLAIYQQQPDAERSLSLVVPRDEPIRPRALAATISRMLSAPWLASTTGAQARTELPPEADARIPGTIPHGPSHPSSPLRPAVFERVTTDRRLLKGLGSILVDSEHVVTHRLRGLDVVGSTRWRGQADALAAVVRADHDAVHQMRGKVSVSPSTVNFFTSSGQLTVTVVNDLSRPVHHLRLSLNPRAYLLRFHDPQQTVQIGASSRATVRFQANGVAAGQVQVDTVLSTPDGLVLGSTPGRATQLTVNVRPTSSWIYWALGIVAGLVLVVGLARSLRSAPRASTTPGPDDEPVVPQDEGDDPTDDSPKAGEDD